MRKETDDITWHKLSKLEKILKQQSLTKSNIAMSIEDNGNIALRTTINGIDYGLGLKKDDVSYDTLLHLYVCMINTVHAREYDLEDKK